MVLTEALASDVPALLNKNILGGWKYINNETGEFFTDENDLEPAVEKMMKKINENKYKPRAYFVKNYSIINSGKKLKKFLYNNYGDRLNIDARNVDYVKPEFSKKYFKQCESVYN